MIAVGLVDYLSKLFHPSKWIRKSTARKRCEERLSKEPTKKFEEYLKKNLEKAKSNREAVVTGESVDALINADKEEDFKQMREFMSQAHSKEKYWQDKLDEYYRVIRGDHD